MPKIFHRLTRPVMAVAMTLFTVTVATADTISRLEVEIAVNDEAPDGCWTRIITTSRSSA